MLNYIPRSTRLLISAFCIAVMFCQLTRAQNPTQTKPADDVVRTTTELVQTDVMVFDRRGNFIESVRPEQFVLSVNGQKRPIALISRVSGGSESLARPVASIHAAAATGVELYPELATPRSSLGRVIFFFVDDLHLSPDSLGRARKALIRFVDDEMDPDDQVAVVSTSGQVGFLQQLTDNRTVLHSAIDRLKDKRNHEGYIGKTKITDYMASQIQDAHNATLFAYLMDSVKIEYGLGGGALRGAHNNDSTGQAMRILHNRIRNIGSQSKMDTSATLAVLRSLMQSSAELPGRKLIFLLSDGFVVDPRGSNALEVLRELAQSAAQVGAVVYSMDTRGTFSDAGVDASRNDFVDMTSRQAGLSLGETMGPRQPLSLLSEETGGRAIFNSNSIDDAIKQAVRETSDYYVLAWRPDAENERSGKARIEVVVEGRPDLRVRLRRNYFKRTTNGADNNQLAAVAKAAPETQLLAALGSSHPRRSLPTSMSAGYVKNETGFNLQVSMEIRREALDADATKTEVDVIGAAIDDRGLVYSFKQLLSVNPQSDPPNQPVIWSQQLTVQPGLYQVRIATRDRQTGRTGSAMQWVNVPPLDADRFNMSSLFLGERSGSGLDNARGPQAVRVDVDHHFLRTSVLRFQTYVYNASHVTGRPDVWIEAQILRGGQQVLALAPNRVPPDVSKDPARLPYWAELPLDQLPAGRYTLRVIATDRARNTTASQTTNFSVN